MLSLRFEKASGLRVLLLGAHSDDIEIGAGGTVLKMIQEGLIGHAHWVVFTSNPVRKQEAEESAGRFLEGAGSSRVEVHSYRDGFLPFHAAEIKEQFELLKQQVNPDLIFTHYRHDRHQDHRLISDLTWNTWRNHMVLEYEIPKYDGDLGTPNSYVALDREILDQKIKLIETSFVSQSSKHWFDADTFMALPRLRGMECASPFAEAFYLRKAVLY
jgi:LmbE family N-acetylglucosaminyl deacetylase